MKLMKLGVAACAASLLLVAGVHGRQTASRTSTSANVPLANSATSEVTLTLATRPISAVISQGDRYAVTLGGTWSSTGTSPVYLQASDSAGTFVAPAPALAPKLSNYRIVLSLPKTTPAGEYTGTFSVRACADSLCAQVHAGTTLSVGYTVTVNAVGEWETLQGNARHDGYVPVQLEVAGYQAAWTWQPPVQSWISAVLTDGANVYFVGQNSIRALRAFDGVPQWQRSFGESSRVDLPAISDGVVYLTVGEGAQTWLYGLRASDGMQGFRSEVPADGNFLFNPAVRNGKVYINAGPSSGVVYAFDLDGGLAWEASGGTSGQNAPAVDDAHVYAFNGTTLDVFDAADGSPVTSIGPSPGGVADVYSGATVLGSLGHVLTPESDLDGNEQRFLLAYSITEGSLRWTSDARYYRPAVAKGVVYATSNIKHSFDALDEATGRVLWSWTPPEPASFLFMDNVVVTDNVAFVSTGKRLYAVSLLNHRAIWSAPTPGNVSISANRMLFVSNPGDFYNTPRITAYRMD
jgi:outer membrane protein assembly factor BamB